jgi:hypothetical protein
MSTTTSRTTTSGTTTSRTTTSGTTNEDICMIDTSSYKCIEQDECEYKNYTYNNNTIELDLSQLYPVQVYQIPDVTTNGLETTTLNVQAGIYVDKYCSIPPDMLNNLITITSPNLQNLKLNNINFNNYAPDDISFTQILNNLTQFEISAPVITKPTSIKENVLLKLLNQMPNIKILNLNRVNMEGYTSSVFTNINNLENIILNNTNVKDTALNGLFLKAIKLKAVHLNNTIKATFQVSQFTFNKLEFLEYFSLFNESVTSSSIKINVLFHLLNKMPNIKYLDLSGNNQLGTTNIKLNTLNKLQQLYLDKTDISQTYLNVILKMTPSLKLLSLSNNDLTQYETSDEFPELPNLEELYLNDIKFNSANIIVELLNKTPNIKKLTLNQNNFDVSNIKIIGEAISQLEHLTNIELDLIDRSDTTTDGISPSILNAQIENIIYPNNNVVNILLSTSKDYNYSILAFRKYEKVLLNTYKIKLDNTKSPYEIINITDKINNLYDPNKNTVKIILIIVMVFIITGALYGGYKIYKAFQNI